jgi:hypothetical protein
MTTKESKKAFKGIENPKTMFGNLAISKNSVNKLSRTIDVNLPMIKG